MMKFMLVLMLLMVAFSKWWLIPLAFVIWKLLPSFNVASWITNNNKITLDDIKKSGKSAVDSLRNSVSEKQG